MLPGSVALKKLADGQRAFANKFRELCGGEAEPCDRVGWWSGGSRVVVVFSNRVVAQYIQYVQELVLQMWAYAIQCININVSKQS